MTRPKSKNRWKAEAPPQTRQDGLRAEPSPAKRVGGGAGGGR
jgi:hypothetical protein